MKTQIQHRSIKTLRHALMAAILGAGGLYAAGLQQPAFAQAPAMQAKQVPGYYRMMLGDIEVTALYDGYVSLDTALLKGATGADIQSLLAQMYVPTSKNGVQTAVNGFLLNTGSNLILVDAGAALCFGPGLGAITQNIRAAGYDVAQVDTVLLTHLHGDHACGIASADGKAVFPNATVHVAKDEAGYWLNKQVAAKAPQAAQHAFQIAQQAVAPYAATGKLKEFTAGDTVVPGVTSVPLHGHTPGHGGYLLSSQGQQLLIWGDVVHSHAVQFARPEVSIDFDSDQAQAIASRKKIFAVAVDKKYWIAGAHLPFPGLGHVQKSEKAYTWVPVEYTPLP